VNEEEQMLSLRFDECSYRYTNNYATRGLYCYYDSLCDVPVAPHEALCTVVVLGCSRTRI
jgi:hypothetical protein